MAIAGGDAAARRFAPRFRGSAVAPGLMIACCLAATAAGAQSLDLPSLYGNETGCRVAAGGAYAGDDKFTLGSDGYEAHESDCEFVEVLSSRSGARVVKALCQGEGSFWLQSIIVSPPDPESDSLLVFFDGGELWHEVRPCT